MMMLATASSRQSSRANAIAGATPVCCSMVLTQAVSRSSSASSRLRVSRSRGWGIMRAALPWSRDDGGERRVLGGKDRDQGACPGDLEHLGDVPLRAQDRQLAALVFHRLGADRTHPDPVVPLEINRRGADDDRSLLRRARM